MTFTCDDLERLTVCVTDAWRSGLDGDWSAPAGTLEWTCGRTADHAVDTVFAAAIFLASRKLDGYPAYEFGTPGPDAPPQLHIEALAAASRVLIAVVSVAEPNARAVIWRRPAIEVRGPADFVPRGALELILHAHDVCVGLSVPFEPDADLCERLRDHTSDWPMWTVGGWSPLSMTGPAWPDLLRASGRG